MFAAIETSFDETGISVCDARGQLTASYLASQIERHKPYGGCVPELAARTHLSDLPQMWRRLHPDLVSQITHLGVTAGPGLPGCLLAGVNFAKGVARALRVPVYGLNHLCGHVLSPFMPVPEDRGSDSPPTVRYPHIALLVSGGHTELFLVEALDRLTLLGQTHDDAVGELLDKISALLGYGYPGGAKLEQLAREYPDITPEARYRGEFKLPVPMRGSGDLNFSYSGLKTAVIRAVRGGDMSSEEQIPAGQHPSLLAALFSVVVESLWIKVAQAVEEHGVDLITVSGGVAINGFIRDRFKAEAVQMGIDARFPAPAQCLDNADMMAWLLNLTVAAGIPPATFDADSNWNPGVPR